MIVTVREHLFESEDNMAREEKSNIINRDMNKDEKLKALDAALTQIEKAYGKGSVMKLGDSRANMNIETIPTGSISLDIALEMCIRDRPWGYHGTGHQADGGQGGYGQVQGQAPSNV